MEIERKREKETSGPTDQVKGTADREKNRPTDGDWERERERDQEREGQWDRRRNRQTDGQGAERKKRGRKAERKREWS